MLNFEDRAIAHEFGHSLGFEHSTLDYITLKPEVKQTRIFFSKPNIISGGSPDRVLPTQYDAITTELSMWNDPEFKKVLNEFKKILLKEP